MANIKTRAAGAQARIGRTGAAEVVSDTGGKLTLNATALEAGFSPLDLLFSAVAGCLVVSARIAAGEMGVLDKFRDARASVHGQKAKQGPSRVTRFDVHFEVEGDFDEATRAALIARAEAICTVSNTLKAVPEFAEAEA